MPVRVSRRRPRTLLSPKRRGRFEKMRPAGLPVTLWRELRLDQVTAIGKKKRGITARRQVDAGAISRLRYGVRRPNLFARFGFQAHEFAGNFGGENVLALQQRR